MYIYIYNFNLMYVWHDHFKYHTTQTCTLPEGTSRVRHGVVCLTLIHLWIVFHLSLSPFQLTDTMILSWKWAYFAMGLLPDTLNDGLRMRRECRERFPRHRLQWKPLISDHSMHPGTCVTHVPWCMTGSQIRGGRESVFGIPGACALHNPQFCVCGKRPIVWCIDKHKENDTAWQGAVLL